MAEAAAHPAPSPWALIDGFVGWSAAVAGLELGLFDALAAQPSGLDRAALAASCGARVDRVETLARALAGLGLLTSASGRFRLAPAAEPLTSSSPQFLGDLLRLSPGRARNWVGLADVVRGGTPPQPVDDDLEGFHAPLARATFGLQRATAAALPDALGLDASPSWRVIDVGAGGGAWSMALLEALPHASAVLIDRVELLEVARAHAARCGVTGRCTFVAVPSSEVLPGAVEERGTEPADVVVLAHVLRHLSPAVARGLVGAAARSLCPQGVVVVADYLLDEEATTERAAALGLVTLANTTAGGLLDRIELAGWLRDAALDPAEDLALSPVFSVVVSRLA